MCSFVVVFESSMIVVQDVGMDYVCIYVEMGYFRIPTSCLWSTNARELQNGVCLYLSTIRIEQTVGTKEVSHWGHTLPCMHNHSHMLLWIIL